MGDEPRMTIPTQLVLRVLLEDPGAELYGSQLRTATGLQSGTLHPILARLERVGWLESHWEDTDPHAEGRPRRRYYRLTPDGAEQARHALASARTQAGALPALRPRPSGGAA